MKRFLIITLFFLLPLLCQATDLKPWFGNEYEAEIRATALYQNYESYATSYPYTKHKENDGFITLSIVYPFKRYAAEFEVTGADTHKQRRGWDDFRITGRYQWLSELEGDPFTFVSGITLGCPYTRAIHDISSCHHGQVEGEFDLSLGKKYGYPLTNNFLYRWWAVVGMGVAEKGSPWSRGNIACEYNYNDTHRFRGFMNTLWGTGTKNLHPPYFKGYGSIRHQSVDIGIRYGFSLGCWGMLSIEYARRVHAKNFPENVNLVLGEYYIPFGSQTQFNY